MVIISAIIILASILLVLVVYVQNPKGGGLSSDFGAAQQIGGVQKTNDFIDKSTWGLALLVGGLSIVLTLMAKSPDQSSAQDEPEQTEQTEGGGGQTQGQTGQGGQNP